MIYIVILRIEVLEDDVFTNGLKAFLELYEYLQHNIYCSYDEYNHLCYVFYACELLINLVQILLMITLC